MAGSDEDAAKVTNHTLAYMRSFDKKLDLVLETQARHTERLGRLERDLADARRDLSEVRSDIALLENKTLSSQTDILTILHRLEDVADLSGEKSESTPPSPGGL